MFDTKNQNRNVKSGQSRQFSPCTHHFRSTGCKDNEKWSNEVINWQWK